MGADYSVNANEYIYADNAATTPMSDKAVEEMMRYLTVDYANISQPYSFSRQPKQAVNNARNIIAKCIGAEPREIFFTSCGTESNNWVIKGTGKRNIITSQIEHHAVLNACLSEERNGRRVTYLPASNTGVILSTSLEDVIINNSLVSVMLSNNEIGTIQDIKKLASIAHRYNCLFHTDAVQSVGHIDIDVKDLGVDYLTASAHKFNGPKGIGFLYVKDGVELNPLINGGSQEYNMRAGTENVAAIVAMAVALKENVNNIKFNYSYILGLESKLITNLEIAGINFCRNGDKNHVPGNISLSFPGFTGESILHRLDLLKIFISTGSACNSNTIKVSHVLNAIGLDEKLAISTVRISLGKENTLDQINAISNAIIKITKQ